LFCFPLSDYPLFRKKLFTFQNIEEYFIALSEVDLL